MNWLIVYSFGKKIKESIFKNYLNPEKKKSAFLTHRRKSFTMLTKRFVRSVTKKNGRNPIRNYIKL